MNHQTRRWTLAAGACAMIIAATVGGCAPRCDRAAAWHLPEPQTASTPAHAPPSGGSWSLVFNSPTVNRAAAGADPRGFPEYARNDASLAYRSDGPVLAGSEWPQRDRPDLAYPRRVYLDPRADQLLFFDYESRYRTSGVYRAVPVAPSDGLWGFWR